MALIHLEQPIRSDPEELLRRFEAEVVSHPTFRAFVDRYEVRGHQVTFHGASGISGVVEVSVGLIVVDLTLSGMAALMKPVVESKLREALARLG